MNLNVKAYNGVYCISAINTTCQSITQSFILFAIKIVYCQGDMFRHLLGHLQALWENRSKSYIHFNALWGPTMHWNINAQRAWRWPNKGRNMSPWQYIIFIVYKIKCCVIDWRFVFTCYNTSGWKTLKRILAFQYRVRWRAFVNTVMNHQLPHKVQTCWIKEAAVTFSNKKSLWCLLDRASLW